MPETAWRIDSTTISATINPHELQHVGVEPGNRCWMNLVSRGRFGPGGMRSLGDADAPPGREPSLVPEDFFAHQSHAAATAAH